MANDYTDIEVDGRSVRISSPGKVYFSRGGETKLDLVQHYLSVAPGALRGVWCRPTVLHRFPHGAEGKSFFQKRVPESRPDWLQTMLVVFPSGRTATELCPVDAAHLIWAANLGCLELHPWAVRRFEPSCPDELRIDLDPSPGVDFGSVRKAALLIRDLLGEHGLEGWPKTSGGRGLHIIVRILPRHGFAHLRSAALALARQSERAAPEVITTEWQKKKRGKRVFFDYNQNAPDRTLASAYSVRPSAQALVSTPLRWEEVLDADPRDFTLTSFPQRWASAGDLEAGMDDRSYSLQPLLDLAQRDQEEGLGDAPWPPYFPKPT